MAKGNILRETGASRIYEKHFEWEIRNFNDLPKSESYVLDSVPFHFHHGEWYLQLYPNGKPEYNCPGVIKIFISLKKNISSEDHQVRFKIGIKKSDGTMEEKVPEFTFKKEARGITVEFMERAALFKEEEGFVAEDGTLIIYFSMSSEGDLHEMGVSPSEDFATLYNHLKNPKLEGFHEAAIITVGGKVFLVHKCFLAARSKFFADKFENETPGTNNRMIELSDCDPDIFELFILFLYTMKLDNVSSSDAMRLYKAAHNYSFQGLKDECSRRMASEMSGDCMQYVLKVLELAGACEDSNLIDTAMEFYRNNGKQTD